LPGDVSGVSGVFGYAACEHGVVRSVRCLCGLLQGSRCIGFAYDPWVTSTTCEPAKAWPPPRARQTARQTEVVPVARNTSGARSAIWSGPGWTVLKVWAGPSVSDLLQITQTVSPVIGAVSGVPPVRVEPTLRPFNEDWLACMSFHVLCSPNLRSVDLFCVNAD
jgi:hypothetical protein